MEPFGPLYHPMNIEITYLYQEDKHSEPVTAWTYFHANTDDFAKAVSQAGTYFKSFAKSNGWTRKVTLKAITQMRTIHDEAPSISVSPDTLPSARKRRSTSNPTSARPRAKKQSSPSASSRTKKAKS